MVEIVNFIIRLNHYITNNPKPDLDPTSRHTYCNLMVYQDNKWHKFEIRSIRIAYDSSMVELGAVNWTLAAGTCTLSISEANVRLFTILEDNPTMQVLYG